MRSTSNLFSSYASCSTEWPPAICETPSAIVFLSSGVTGSAERPHQGCQRIHQMVQNTRSPPASRKKSRPDNSDLSVPMLFLLQSAIEYAAFWISFVGLAKKSPVFGIWLLCECHAAKCTALAKCLAAHLAEKTRVIFPTWLEAKNRCQCVHAIAAVLTDHGRLKLTQNVPFRSGRQSTRVK